MWPLRKQELTVADSKHPRHLHPLPHLLAVSLRREEPNMWEDVKDRLGKIWMCGLQNAHGAHLGVSECVNDKGQPDLALDIALASDGRIVRRGTAGSGDCRSVDGGAI